MSLSSIPSSSPSSTEEGTRYALERAASLVKFSRVELSTWLASSFLLKPAENSGKLTCLDGKTCPLIERGFDFSIPRRRKVKIFRMEESSLMEDFRNKEVSFVFLRKAVDLSRVFVKHVKRNRSNNTYLRIEGNSFLYTRLNRQ